MINIITGISIAGLTIGTAAILLILSVFNGFESILTSLFNTFHPDIRIEARQGSFFYADAATLHQIRKSPGIQAISLVCERNALFTYGEYQDFGIIKGVDSSYTKVCAIDTVLQQGNWWTGTVEQPRAIVGSGVERKLNISIEDPRQQLTVYMPSTSEGIGLGGGQNFTRRFLTPAAVFAIHQDVDNQYVITNLALVQDLIHKPGALSAIECRMQSGIHAEDLAPPLQKILGNNFIIKDKKAQNSTFLRIMRLEKWLAFIILLLAIILVLFNLVGALWMVILDKKKDIAILRSMGMLPAQIQAIFLRQGISITVIGVCTGIVLALGIYFLQKAIGFIPVPEGFIVDSYPVSLQFWDFIAVFIATLMIGTLASWIPARMARLLETRIQEE